MPKLRQNPVTGDWVVIAPERQARPEDYANKIDKGEMTSIKDCLFCENGAAWKERIEGLGTKKVYVIPNKFPAFVSSEALIEEGNNIYWGGKSIGGHEVIVMEDHKDDVFHMEKDSLVDLFELMQERYNTYGRDPAIQYVMAFHNHGEEAGASVDHAHSQLIASCVIPPSIDKELKESSKYYLKTGKCIFCEIIKAEMKQKERLILENETAVAITPFAPRFPFEIWVMPKKHLSDWRDFDDIDNFCGLLFNIFQKIKQKLGHIPLNFFIHSSPVYNNATTSYHWHVEITPRLNKLGGYEIGSGLYINVMSPEKAALFLRG